MQSTSHDPRFAVRSRTRAESQSWIPRPVLIQGTGAQPCMGEILRGKSTRRRELSTLLKPRFPFKSSSFSFYLFSCFPSFLCWHTEHRQGLVVGISLIRIIHSPIEHTISISWTTSAQEKLFLQFPLQSMQLTQKCSQLFPTSLGFF